VEEQVKSSGVAPPHGAERKQPKNSENNQKNFLSEPTNVRSGASMIIIMPNVGLKACT
jgi:hypothetical protein